MGQASPSSRDARRIDDLEELAGAGTWSVDVADLRPAWSAGQHRLHGAAPGSVGSIDDWEVLVHPDDRTMWRDALDRTLAGGAGFAMDHRIVRADDGRVRWLRERGRLDAGTLHGVSLDTTAERAAMASIQTFVADAAHELRTPAAAIGQAVAALMVVADAHRDEVTAVLARQAARLRSLTTDLVDLVQLDAGPTALVLEPVPLREAVEAALSHVPAPDDRHVTTDVAAGLAVLATPGHLDRILVNLLTNAYRYGGRHVSVSARSDGDRVVVEVVDDGPGVPDEVVGELFQAFRRGPQRHPEASGIGLAIVARLVDRFGGAACYRAGDPGAVFVLDLERARS